MILKTHAQAMQMPPHPINLQEMPSQYEQVEVTGHYLAFYFLLDNQQHLGHTGYDVITPFLMTNGLLVFINRGFIAAPVTRSVLPDIGVLPEHLLSVKGTVYYPYHNVRHGPLIDKTTASCMVIEAIDMPFMRQILHKSSVPFIMRLDGKEPYGFLRQWPLVSVLPARHIAYAIQWAAMALVLLAIFIGLCVKKIK